MEDCKWCLNACIVRGTTLFRIVKLNKNHTCSVSDLTSDQRHATAKVVGGVIVEMLRNPDQQIRPSFVVGLMKREHGVSIGYHKAWRSVQATLSVIRGSPEENYNLLPSYLHMMREKNPGTYTSIKTDDENRYAVNYVPSIYIYYLCAIFYDACLGLYLCYNINYMVLLTATVGSYTCFLRTGLLLRGGNIVGL